MLAEEEQGPSAAAQACQETLLNAQDAVSASLMQLSKWGMTHEPASLAVHVGQRLAHAPGTAQTRQDAPALIRTQACIQNDKF